MIESAVPVCPRTTLPLPVLGDVPAPIYRRATVHSAVCGLIRSSSEQNNAAYPTPQFEDGVDSRSKVLDIAPCFVQVADALVVHTPSFIRVMHHFLELVLDV